MTLALYARRKGWPLDGVTVRLTHSRIHAQDCASTAPSATAVNITAPAILVIERRAGECSRPPAATSPLRSLGRRDRAVARIRPYGRRRGGQRGEGQQDREHHALHHHVTSRLLSPLRCRGRDAGFRKEA